MNLSVDGSAVLSAATATEGTGADAGTYTATLTNRVAGKVTATVAVPGGTDVTGEAEVTFTAGAGATLTVTADSPVVAGMSSTVRGTLVDAFGMADEPDETFTVDLRNPSDGVTLGDPASLEVTITDDDVPWRRSRVRLPWTRAERRHTRSPWTGLRLPMSM